jgi:hypothetical protein
MDYDAFITFVTRVYGKPHITTNDLFTEEGRKTFKAHTPEGLIIYTQLDCNIVRYVNGLCVARYEVI